MQSDLRIGDNSYVVYTAVEGMAGMSAPFELGSAPVIENNTAYVPIDLFVPLFGNDPATVKTGGDTITINRMPRPRMAILRRFESADRP
ncbi:MAG: hypothetical protein ACLUT5_14500 [Butyricicoccus sp.]